MVPAEVMIAAPDPSTCRAPSRHLARAGDINCPAGVGWRRDGEVSSYRRAVASAACHLPGNIHVKACPTLGVEANRTISVNPDNSARTQLDNRLVSAVPGRREPMRSITLRGDCCLAAQRPHDRGATALVRCKTRIGLFTFR